MSDKTLDVSLSTLVSCYLENEKDMDFDGGGVLLDNFTIGASGIEFSQKDSGRVWRLREVDYTTYSQE